MVETHFGLRQRPFPATPDPACYYPATSHEQALERLLGGLADGEGLLLLTGAPGTGKTLLGRCLLERLGEGVCSALLTNSHVPGRTGLLQALLYDLALPYEGLDEQELRLNVTDHLLKSYAGGQQTVLLVDEAHHLSADLLEELRLLGNLEGRSGKALQVILLGLPLLQDRLSRPELSALRQRLAVRATLAPLDVEEAADYLLHHLRAAGGRPERILTDEAVELLARGTQGIPRLLNQAGHQALALAQQAGSAQVDAEAALEALTLLELTEGMERTNEAVARESSPAGEEGGLEASPVLPLTEEDVGHQVGDPACRLFVSPGRPA